MSIDAKTKLYGLIGNPIAHSLSPLLHNYLAEKFSVNAAYLPLNVHFLNHDNTSRINDLFSAMKIFNISGANVTSPYKELVASAPLIMNIPSINNQNFSVRFGDVPSKITRSVNTIKYVNGSFLLFNTDVYGISNTLSSYNLSVKNKNVFVFGAGGAASSLLFALASLSPSKIYIANRNFLRAASLASYFSSFFPHVHFLPLNLSHGLHHFCLNYNISLAVQATPLGSLHLPNLSPVCDPSFFLSLPCAFDLIYNPPLTPFLAHAQANGASIINGFCMFVSQALKSFQIWHGFNFSNNQFEQIFNSISQVLHYES